MSTIVRRNVDDLPEPSRTNLEELLGHSLRPHQSVYIIVDALRSGPSATVKEQAAQGIRRILAEAQRHAEDQGVSAAEADAAVEEAMFEIRRRS
jgi:hypothetical protein